MNPRPCACKAPALPLRQPTDICRSMADHHFPTNPGCAQRSFPRRPRAVQPGKAPTGFPRMCATEPPTDVRNGASHSGGVHRGARSTTRDESRRVILLSTAMAFIGERKARSCFSGFPNLRGVRVGSLSNLLTCVFVGFVGLGCFIAVLRRCSAGYSRWIFDGNGLLFVVFGRRKRLAWMEICRTYV